MDATEVKPKFMPDDALTGRDQSGGPGFSVGRKNGMFGDGGDVMGGNKPHLTPSGGSRPPKD